MVGGGNLGGMCSICVASTDGSLVFGKGLKANGGLHGSKEMSCKPSLVSGVDV